MHKDTTYQGSDRQDFYRHGKKKKKKKEKEKKEKKENKQTKRRPRLGLPIGNPVKIKWVVSDSTEKCVGKQYDMLMILLKRF